MKLAPLFRALFPAACLACGEGTAEARRRLPGLCAACHGALPVLPETCCPLCAEPQHGLTPDQAGLCQRCLLEERSFEAGQALFLYAAPVRQLILAAKYRRMPVLFHELLHEGLERRGVRPPHPDALVSWVPAEPWRRMTRGAHGAALLARDLARHWQRPAAALLYRKPWSAPQQGADFILRRRRARKAYGLLPFTARVLKGRSVMLVDDVLTTGATLEVCSSLLLQAGAASVEVFCLARDP